MNDSAHMQVRVLRSPLPDVDVFAVSALRAALCAELAEVVRADGALSPVARFFGIGFVEEAPLDALVPAGEEMFLAAFFLRASQRQGIVRCFRAGEVRFTEEGLPVRAVALLEWMPGDRWWAAWRVLHEDDSGQVTFGGAWSELVGEGLDGLILGLRAWVDADGATVEAMDESRPGPGVPPDIRAAVVPLTGEIPEDPRVIARAISADLDAEALRGSLDCLLVLVFRQAALERWEVRGDLPCGIDDLVRAIAAQDTPDAVAVVQIASVRLDGALVRALVTQVERFGRRGIRVLPIDLSEAARASAMRPLYQDQGSVRDDGWIGVAPRVEVALTALAPFAWGDIAEG